MKEFVVFYRDFYVLLFVDDKNYIFVGELGFFIIIIYRSKKVVIYVNILNIVVNYDIVFKCKFLLFVVIVIEVFEDVLGDFYNG